MAEEHVCELFFAQINKCADREIKEGLQVENFTL